MYEGPVNQRINSLIKERTEYHLDDDLTGRKPWGYILDDHCMFKVKPVLDWVDLYVSVCRYIVKIKPQRFEHLVDNHDAFQSRDVLQFSRDKSNFERPKPLANGIYANAITSTNQKFQYLRIILESCGYAPDALKLYLEPMHELIQNDPDFLNNVLSNLDKDLF